MQVLAVVVAVTFGLSALVSAGPNRDRLCVSGTIPVALAFAVVTGFGIGAFSPLQGIKIEEIVIAATGAAALALRLSGRPGPLPASTGEPST